MITNKELRRAKEKLERKMKEITAKCYIQGIKEGMEESSHYAQYGPEDWNRLENKLIENHDHFMNIG